MRSISALDVRARFGQVLDQAAAGERFIVERAGQPVAAIVPLADLDHMDPDRIRERRLAAVEQMVRLGRRDRRRYGPFDAVAAIREDRDHGHRP
jgi:prevent-host-death family protein